MSARTLESSPSILPLYARAAAPMVPGASLLPFIPGGGKEIPEIELTLPQVHADPELVAAYARVCGFTLRDHLPPTYPHVLAFPLQLALMTDRSFPLALPGMVHVRNRIEVSRPIGAGERLDLQVWAERFAAHRKGATVRLKGGKMITTDGPFSEAKEVIGGFTIMNLKSKEEAIAEAVKFMELHRKLWPQWDGVTEIRLMYEENEHP